MPDKYSIGLSKRYPAMPTAPTGNLPPPGSSCRGGRERICLCFSGHSMQNAVQMRHGKNLFCILWSCCPGGQRSAGSHRLYDFRSWGLQENPDSMEE